jgi:hypothetical protein
MSPIALVNRTRGVILLAAAGAVAATMLATAGTAAVSGRGACNEAQVRRIVYAFTTALNRGDAKQLRALWATQAHFKWYSAGRSPKQHYVIYGRAAMLRYFAARHRRKETLTLTRWRFNGVSHGHAHFSYSLTRRADDLAAGDAEPYHGKGAASCAGMNPRLAVWSMARDRRA